MKKRNARVEDKEASSAFTLIELLVTVAIIGILMGIVSTGSFKARQKAEQVQCAAVLRRIGMAVQDYAADHKTGLPGPMARGLYARYTGASNQLITFLAPYLDLPGRPTGEIVEKFVCPGWRRKGASENAVAWWSCKQVAGHDEEMFDPWGYPRANNRTTYPQRLFNMKDPSTAQALVDVDLEMGASPGWGRCSGEAGAWRGAECALF